LGSLLKSGGVNADPRNSPAPTLGEEWGPFCAISDVF
jgi:hypothetical protein